MGILDKVVKIERTLEKLTVRKDAPVTPLEIRRAILDDIEAQTQPAGRSRRVFPYDEIAIEVLAAPERRKEAPDRVVSLPGRAELEAVLDPGEGFADAIRERLREAGCDRVGRLEVSVRVVTKRRPDWQPDAVFQVKYQRVGAEQASPAGRRAGAGIAPPARMGPATDIAAATTQIRHAQIVVLEGNATKKAYTLTGERTNIGRMAEVADKHRRILRRNQVVFLDVDEETNQTVSRAQAHLEFTAPADYRLFDDRSSYGTRISRAGRMIELPSGSPRGAKLQPGDEIYFGRARVVFQLK